MKAKIKLEVDIDLDKIIDYDNLESLKKFTSSTNSEEVATYYVQNVARAISTVSELNLPHVEFNIKGEIFEEGHEQEQVDLNKFVMEDVAEGIEQVDCLLDDEEVTVVVDKEPLPTYAKEEAYKRIGDIIQDCTKNKGFPKFLYVAPELFDMIFIDGDNRVGTFMGCDVIPSEIESAVLQVAYEPFGKEKELEFFAVEKL